MYSKFNKLKIFHKIIILFCLLNIKIIFAENPIPFSQHKEWSVFYYLENNKKICFAATTPKKTTLPIGLNRKEVFFRVSQYQFDKIINTINISIGYFMKINSVATATINNKIYLFFTQNQEAWPINNITEKQLLIAMKIGLKMTIQTINRKNIKTIDTYSLLGVTDAISASKKLCQL